MSVFFLVEIKEILRPGRYREYREKAAPIILQHGGEYIIKSEQLHPVSGEWDTKRIILIRFADIDNLRDCFQSIEYREISHLREASTISKAIVIT